MRKKEKLILIVASICILFSGFIYAGYQVYRIKHAKIIVNLKESLVVEVGTKVKVSDFLESINGTLLDDFSIDTKNIGTKEVSFRFRNDENIKVRSSFSLEIVDTTAPIVWLNNNYSVAVGSDDSFIGRIMCVDNYDVSPVCKINGTYDLNTTGVYPVEFEASDASGNVFRQKFSLTVYEPKRGGSSSTTSPTKTVFADVVRDYKTDRTQIGLDLSHWQGDVDFEELKRNDVEFVFLRVGTTNGRDGEFVLDKKFEQNITKANEVGIPVGLYFYSYANTEEKAIQEAKWLLEQIKGRKVDLPIAFDWENWSKFNEFHLSLLGLSSMADGFIKTVEEAGYQGILYSSKSYLEKIWPSMDHDVWLAHYTSKTNYQGDYDFWQMCSDGVISGINGFVDINVRYLK